MKRVTMTTAGYSHAALLAFFALLCLTPSLSMAQTGDMIVEKRACDFDGFCLPGEDAIVADQGQTITFAIAVSNPATGDRIFRDVRLTDDFDMTMLQNVTWTCAGTVPRNCPNPPFGTGDIDEVMDYRPGQRALFQVRAEIRNCVAGLFTNTAEITVDPADAPFEGPAGNNTDTTPVTVFAIADIQVDKDDGVTEVDPGDNIAYQIVVRNDGPDCDPAVRVEDIFPPELINVSWSCIGDECPVASGVGNIDQTLLELRRNREVTFAVAATVDPSTTSCAVVNTALAETRGETQDPEMGNNTDDDTDAIFDCGVVVPTLPELGLFGLMLALLVAGARSLRSREGNLS